jgi:hypothetical protein
MQQELALTEQRVAVLERQSRQSPIFWYMLTSVFLHCILHG